jgi:uncharacterized protein YndB with AHSA1/START domain
VSAYRRIGVGVSAFGGAKKFSLHPENGKQYLNHMVKYSDDLSLDAVFGALSDSTQNSLVTVEFIEFGGSTEIRLTHENLPSDEQREAHHHGWSGCFDKMQKYLGH